MRPERAIAVPRDAFDAAAELRYQLDAVAPGKYPVGVGLKQTGGAFTNQLALFVYVQEKRPAREVPEAELVPPVFGDYITDVVEHRLILAADNKRYDPLCGGIQISRDQIDDDGNLSPPPGTLGAIVTDRETGNLQLLTCAHVVHELFLDIFQPRLGVTGSSIVGRSINFRWEEVPIVLDCAVIESNEARELDMSVEDIGPVQGVVTEVPDLGQVMKKRGMRTLLTEGFVARMVPLEGHGFAIEYIELAGFSTADPSGPVFAGPGDSGSVVLNEFDEVIALLFAIPPGADIPGGLSSGGYATPIHHVQEALQVDIAVGP
jgi:hypothetical protein